MLAKERTSGKGNPGYWNWSTYFKTYTAAVSVIIEGFDFWNLERELLSLEGRQKSNLLKFLELYYKSLNENELFFGFYEPHDIVAERNDKILKLISKFVLES